MDSLRTFNNCKMGYNISPSLPAGRYGGQVEDPDEGCLLRGGYTLYD